MIIIYITSSSFELLVFLCSIKIHVTLYLYKKNSHVRIKSIEGESKVSSFMKLTLIKS